MPTVPDQTALTTMTEAELYAGIGDMVRAWREERSMTQAELAAHVGLSRASVVNIEAGRQHVPLYTLYRICQCLQTNLVELLAEVD